MSRPPPTVTRLRLLWARLSPLPGGRWLFSRLLGWMIPYTGSIGGTVVEFSPGRVRVRMRDRRRVRNHLASVHAIALANLGEVTSGLALVGALPETARGILTGLEVSYSKKARGTLECSCACDVPVVEGPAERLVRASIVDASGDEVATVTARWLLGPRPSSPS